MSARQVQVFEDFGPPVHPESVAPPPRPGGHPAHYPADIADRCPVTLGSFQYWRAIEMARYYKSTPQVETLMNDWGVSRATAYRFRAALAAANGDTVPGEYQRQTTVPKDTTP